MKEETQDKISTICFSILLIIGIVILALTLCKTL